MKTSVVTLPAVLRYPRCSCGFPTEALKQSCQKASAARVGCARLLEGDSQYFDRGVHIKAIRAAFRSKLSNGHAWAHFALSCSSRVAVRENPHISVEELPSVVCSPETQCGLSTEVPSSSRAILGLLSQLTHARLPEGCPYFGRALPHSACHPREACSARPKCPRMVAPRPRCIPVTPCTTTRGFISNYGENMK
jgi:hypothetical protein